MEVTKQSFRQVFEGETEIVFSTPPLSSKTELFSPLPGEDIVFYFQACYRYRNGNELQITNLNLIRSSDSKCYSSLVMSIEASIYHSDGSLFIKFKPQSDIKIDNMAHLTLYVDTRVLNAPIGGRNTDNQRAMLNMFNRNNFPGQYNLVERKYLTVRYKMSFNGYISKTALSRNAKSSSSKFSNNLKRVYESAVFNDFVFKVGEKSFPVHKVILVAHSPVFLKMITQDFQESKTNRVTITDTTSETFEMFLKYLYCGEIEDESWPSVKDLYCLADKYDVGILKNDCTDIVVSLLCMDLVCEILKLAYIYDDSSIKSAAKKFSVNHIKQLLPREDWQDLVVEHPIIGYEVIVNFAPA